MEFTKTAALICKKRDRFKGMVYEALLFITDTPYNITDEDLEEKIHLSSLHYNNLECSELIVKADILSTSNEVQEQFEHLHPYEEPVPEVSFKALH